MNSLSDRRSLAVKPLRFAIGRCSLGWVLAASGDRGVRAVLMGDDAETLRGDLAARFPGVTLIEGGQESEAALARAVAAVEAPAGGLDLPLDIGGTAFQRRVWNALRAIPAGATASYGEIAGKIGAPGAARAVARACAANPLAVAVPCHRVVRGDGSLSGYRWGADRKRVLLEREGAA